MYRFLGCFSLGNLYKFHHQHIMVITILTNRDKISTVNGIWGGGTDSPNRKKIRENKQQMQSI